MLQYLPELALDVVCDHLSYEDVLRLRCTCKALKEFVDRKKFTRLNLFVRKYLFHHQLFQTDEQVGYEHSLHSDDTAILHSTRFREQFANVQRMVICTKRSWTELRKSDATGFDLNPLNFFRAINHLEVDGFTSIGGKLNLQELRIVSLRIGFGNSHQESSIKLDCPRLRALRMDQCCPVLTGETTQLEYLRYSPQGEPTDYLLRISPNLRKLSTISIQSAEKTMQLLSDLKMDRLSLPSLDQIQLEPSNKENALFRLGELASSLKDLRRDPQKRHIKFTFCGRPIRSPDELPQIDTFIRDNFWVGSMCTRNLGACSLWFLNDLTDLTRTATGPKVHQIKINFNRIVKFDTLHAMIEYYDYFKNYKNPLPEDENDEDKSSNWPDYCSLM